MRRFPNKVFGTCIFLCTLSLQMMAARAACSPDEYNTSQEVLGEYSLQYTREFGDVNPANVPEADIKSARRAALLVYYTRAVLESNICTGTTNFSDLVDICESMASPRLPAISSERHTRLSCVSVTGRV